MRGAILCVVFVCVALVSAGCDEPLSSITGPTPNLEPTLSSIQTQLHHAQEKAYTYEPLTPPASFASVSPAGSSSGHESLPAPVPPPPSPGSVSTDASTTDSTRRRPLVGALVVAAP